MFIAAAVIGGAAAGRVTAAVILAPTKLLAGTTGGAWPGQVSWSRLWRLGVVASLAEAGPAIAHASRHRVRCEHFGGRRARFRVGRLFFL